MRINLSGPRSLDHLKLMGIAGSLLKTDELALSDMRYGAANGKACQCKAGNVMYNVYIFKGKDQINIDVQEAYNEAPIDMDRALEGVREEHINQKIGGTLDDYS